MDQESPMNPDNKPNRSPFRLVSGEESVRSVGARAVACGAIISMKCLRYLIVFVVTADVLLFPVTVPLAAPEMSRPGDRFLDPSSSVADGKDGTRLFDRKIPMYGKSLEL